MTTFAHDKFTTKCKSIKQRMKKTFKKRAANKDAANKAVRTEPRQISAPLLVYAPRYDVSSTELLANPATFNAKKLMALAAQSANKKAHSKVARTTRAPISVPMLVCAPYYCGKTIDLKPRAAIKAAQRSTRAPIQVTEPTPIKTTEPITSIKASERLTPIESAQRGAPINAAEHSIAIKAKHTTRAPVKAPEPITPDGHIMVDYTKDMFAADIDEYVEHEYAGGMAVEDAAIEDQTPLLATRSSSNARGSCEASGTSNILASRVPSSCDAPSVEAMHFVHNPRYEVLVSCMLMKAGEQPTFAKAGAFLECFVHERHSCGKYCLQVNASLLSKDELQVNIVPTCGTSGHNDPLRFFFESRTISLPHIADALYDSRATVYVRFGKDSSLCVDYFLEGKKYPELAAPANPGTTKSRQSSIASNISCPDTINTVSSASSAGSVTPAPAKYLEGLTIDKRVLTGVAPLRFCSRA